MEKQWIEKLQQLFPQSKLVDSPMNDYSIQLEQKWLYIPKKDITPTEQALLDILLKHINPSPVNAWQSYLTGNSTQLPNSVHSLQCVYINHSTSFFAHEEWLQLFATLDESFLSYFSMNEQQTIILYQHAPSTQAIQGILTLIEDDFGMKMTVLIGQKWLHSTLYSSIFKQELALFSHYYADTSTKTYTCSTLLLWGMIHQHDNTLQLLQSLQQQLHLSEEQSILIKTLWKAQGNLSKAANQLFIHRNTLQYRMEKYFEETQLNLKKSDDLAISYFLTQLQV